MRVSAVRLRPALMAGFLCLLLSACMAPLLVGPQSQLMWALLKPLVGFDPNEVDLFEQPLIKNRMQPLLGEHYDTTVSLLKTANQIQQEGPLFYVLSKTPATQALADQAGFVWNSQTNQMAVLLQEQGKQQVFAESIAGAAGVTAPTWPTAMQGLLNPQALGQQAGQQLGAAASQAVGTATQAAGQAATEAVESTLPKVEQIAPVVPTSPTP